MYDITIRNLLGFVFFLIFNFQLGNVPNSQTICSCSFASLKICNLIYFFVYKVLTFCEIRLDACIIAIQLQTCSYPMHMSDISYDF